MVGRVGKPHGLKGEVTVEVRTDEPERRFAVGSRLRAEPPRGSASPLRALTVARTRWHQGVLLATFEELADRNAAEGARGILLHVVLDPADVPDDPDEFYDHQLVGLAAYDVDGTPLGEVRGLVHGAAQDLLTVRTRDGRDALVPFVKALVPEVDVAGGRVVIADRPGLVAPLPEEEHVRIDVVTIFPDYLAPLELSLAGKAVESGLLEVHVHDLRGWTHDRHRTVDDTPYGGGAGMVMKPEPWGEALDEVLPDGATLVVPTPSGIPFTQALARELAGRERLVFACGRYEGIDQRVVDEAGVACRGARGVDRRLRAERGRGGCARDHRGGRAAAARLHGQPRVAAGGVPRGRPAGVPRLHEARELAGAGRAARPALG